MPLVNLAPTVTFTVKDETGSTSEVQTSILAATTIADARTAANGLIAEIQAASQCVVQGYAINFSTVEAAPAAPAAGSRVERKGVLKFRAAGGKMATVTIPGINPAVVLSSGRLNDDTEAIADLRARFLAAPFSDSNGQPLTAMVEAYEDYRTTRKRQKPTDRVPDADAVA